MEWSYIETAPDDGSEVILFNGEIGIGCFHKWSRDKNGRIIGLERERYKDEWEWCGEGFKVIPEPTHWMPLPKKPEV